MDNNEFIALCKKLIAPYYLNKLKPEDIYVVWVCKTLQNNKALVATTLEDGKYYEITYNGDYKVAYVDVYRKERQDIYTNENAD